MVCNRFVLADEIDKGILENTKTPGILKVNLCHRGMDDEKRIGAPLHSIVVVGLTSGPPRCPFQTESHHLRRKQQKQLINTRLATLGFIFNSLVLNVTYNNL